MNSVQLIGRLTRDPEVRYTDGGSSVAKFSIAVDRRFKQDGQDSADFINCVTFGKTAEFVEKYFRKGNRIGITGRIQTGSYTNKDGQKVYTTDVVAETVEFTESKGGSAKSNSEDNTQADRDGFVSVPDGINEELPFN